MFENISAKGPTALLYPVTQRRKLNQSLKCCNLKNWDNGAIS
jgi:hypothetical protein